MNARFALLMPSVIVLSACTSTMGAASSDVQMASSGQVVLRIEDWDQFETLADGRCRLMDESGLQENISRGTSVVLVGPDDRELGASSFGAGTLQKTGEVDAEYWANLPADDVCVFEARFNDIPDASTYRVKYRDGYIDALSISREQLDASGGTFVVIFGGEVNE